ncbi:MAG TPA: hypothetical protein VF723_11240 [Pyrinomonadaceae bacterium]|jgi:hypothetical protein
MLLDGADMNELLVTIAEGAILRKFDAQPHNLGRFRDDGSLIDYPERPVLNALLNLEFVKPKQGPVANGGEFTAYKLTDKGLRYVEVRGRNMASINEIFWAIVHEHDNSNNVYFYIGTAAPDLSRLVEGNFDSGDKITITCHEIDSVPSNALLLQDDQLKS